MFVLVCNLNHTWPPIRVAAWPWPSLCLWTKLLNYKTNYTAILSELKWSITGYLTWNSHHGRKQEKSWHHPGHPHSPWEGKTIYMRLFVKTWHVSPNCYTSLENLAYSWFGNLLLVLENVHFEQMDVNGSYSFYHGPNVSWAMVLRPPIQEVTQWHLNEQSRTNISAMSATGVQ